MDNGADVSELISSNVVKVHYIGWVLYTAVKAWNVFSFPNLLLKKSNVLTLLNSNIFSVILFVFGVVSAAVFVVTLPAAGLKAIFLGLVFVELFKGKEFFTCLTLFHTLSIGKEFKSVGRAGFEPAVGFLRRVRAECITLMLRRLRSKGCQAVGPGTPRNAPLDGLEPPTLALTGRRSAIELQGNTVR